MTFYEALDDGVEAVRLICEGLLKAIASPLVLLGWIFRKAGWIK